MMIQTIFLAIVILLSACTPTWSLIKENHELHQVGEISFKLPLQWVMFNDYNHRYTIRKQGEDKEISVDRAIVTHNGFGLDVVAVMSIDLKDAFPNIERQASTSMLPSELAERYIAEQKIKLGIDYFKITQNIPVTISDLHGFQIQFHYRDNDKLQIEHLTIGFVLPQTFVTFTFRAPSVHYFTKGLPTFKKILQSIEFPNVST